MSSAISITVLLGLIFLVINRISFVVHLFKSRYEPRKINEMHWKVKYRFWHIIVFLNLIAITGFIILFGIVAANFYFALCGIV